MRHAPQGYCLIQLGHPPRHAREIVGVDPTSVVLQETRKKAATISVTWEGLTDYDVLDGDDLAEAILLHWTMGYDGIPQERRGTFVITKVSRKYSDGAVTLTFEAKDKGVDLVDAVGNVVYEGITASDLARVAATRLGLEADVDETEVRYDHLAMAGKTMGQLLTEVSSAEDHEFYVDDNTLYLKPANRDGEIDVILSYMAVRKGSKGNYYLTNLSVERETRSKKAADCRKITGTGESGNPQTGAVDNPDTSTPTNGPPKPGDAAATKTKGRDSVTFSYHSNTFKETLVSKDTKEVKFKALSREEFEALGRENNNTDSEGKGRVPLNDFGQTPTQALVQRAKASGVSSDDKVLADAIASGTTAEGSDITVDQIAQLRTLDRGLIQAKTFRDQGIQLISHLKHTNPPLYATTVTDLENSYTFTSRTLSAARRKLLSFPTHGEVSKANALGCVLSSTPQKNAKFVKVANQAAATFVAYRGLKLSAQLYGILLRPRLRVAIDGVIDQDVGPWLVDQTTTTYRDNDLSLTFSCKRAPKLKKKSDSKDGEKDPGGGGGVGGKGGSKTKNAEFKLDETRRTLITYERGGFSKDTEQTFGDNGLITEEPTP